jgi:hypothetical protein
MTPIPSSDILKVQDFTNTGETKREAENVNTSRKNLRWAGVFYIIATLAPILTFPFVGLLGGGVAGEPTPDYLVDLSANERQVIVGMLIELVWVLAVVGIIVTLFPILKMHNEALALGFSALRFIEAISTVVGSIVLLTLLTLSQDFVKAGVPEASHYQTMGTLLLAAREWAFMIGSGLIWSLSALILNLVLYQSKLIPRWLSGWGLLGGTLSFAAYLSQSFGANPTELLFLPIAVQEMVFAVWLIFKGFRSSAVASESAE